MTKEYAITNGVQDRTVLPSLDAGIFYMHLQFGDTNTENYYRRVTVKARGREWLLHRDPEDHALNAKSWRTCVPRNDDWIRVLGTMMRDNSED